MTRTSMIGRAAAAVALLSAIAATAALAHGNPDQMNDPPTGSGWYCAQDGADQLYQGFVPTRRLLSSFEIRIFKRFNFPASGMTLTGRVHTGTGTGAVVGTATATVPPGGPDELLVHFDFSPAAVLEPQGTFVFELAQPESGIRWMGRNDNPYAAAPSFDCDGSTADATIDFNFGSYMPPDGGPPQTSIDSDPRQAAISRQRTAELTFSASDDLTYATSLALACQLDGKPYAPCTSPVSIAGLADGVHRFVVTATDQAALASSSTSSWTVDATPPSRPTVAGPRRPAAGRASYGFASRDAMDRARQLRFQCAFDSRRLRPCERRITRRVSRGQHVLRVIAADRAGNVSRQTIVRIAAR
jgi:hypothetical protein